MNQDGDIVFDSLPYIDGQLNLEEAELLIEKEIKMMVMGKQPSREEDFQLFAVCIPSWNLM